MIPRQLAAKEFIYFKSTTMNKKIIAFLVLVSVFYYQQGLAQKAKPDYKKLHYLSEEEMYMDFDPTRDFYITDPPIGPIRNVAEFERMQGVLIRYPFGISYDVIKEMAEDILVVTIVKNQSDENYVLSQYNSNGVNTDNCEFLHAPTNSYWTRDYGPWFVFDGNNEPGIVNFPYNRPRPNDNDIPIEVANYLGIELYGMNLETAGGNYMCDGMGKAASTDLIWQENMQYTHAEIDGLVEDYLGIEEYFVTADPLGYSIKHIDCWGKFLTPGKILIGQVPVSDDRYDDYEAIADYYSNTISSYGVPYEVFRVYTPGTYPYTPYTNSLILNKKVLVPITGSQWDDEALVSYEQAMPGYEIVGIMYGSWLNTDALHCRTKGIADIGMLYFNHIPLLGEVQYEESIDVTTEIMAYSGEEIYADSVFLIYSINDSNYDSILMEYQDGNTWAGYITNLSVGDEVNYYLFAADESERRANHPYIGKPDPHEFTVVGNPENELVLQPDTVLFLNMDDMWEGIELHIINNMDVPVTINDITENGWENGSEIPWFVEQMPVLPYQIMEGDSLSLNIMCDIPVALSGELLIDTIYIETDNSIYKGLIMIDSDLLSGFEENEKVEISVYPNPFKDHLNIEFFVTEQTDYEFIVFDISGRLIDKITDKTVSGNNIITWNVSKTLQPGYYFYKLKAGNISKSGKIILNR